MSQEGLANEAGVDRSYVSLLERGIKSPTLRMVFRLAGILGVTAAEMVGKAEAVMGSGKAATVNTSGGVDSGDTSTR